MIKPKFDLTTIGETVLRLSVPAGVRLETMTTLDVYPAGAEANVAYALSRLGRRCSWIGGLPINPLGRYVANQLRMAGVVLDAVVWREDGRMGAAFIEFATPPRAIDVIYDRENSVASRLQPDQIAWDHLLNTRLLHLTGITPALSESCLTVIREAVDKARSAGIPISFDVNYRSKLWSPARARETLLPIIQASEILFCGQGDAATLFGCTGEPEQVVANLVAQSKARHVVVSFGDDEVVARDGKQCVHVPTIPVVIVDRIGAGDSLATGVIHGWLNGDFVQGLRYGVVLAALVLAQHGDMLITSEEELLALLEDASGGVDR